MRKKHTLEARTTLDNMAKKLVLVKKKTEVVVVEYGFTRTHLVLDYVSGVGPGRSRDVAAAGGNALAAEDAQR